MKIREVLKKSRIGQIVPAGLSRFMGKNRQDPSLENKLSDLSGSINATLIGVEDKFLTLGQTLQSVFTKTETLKNLVVSTSDFSREDGGDSGISNVSTLTEKSLKKLTGYQDDILDNLKMLNTGSEHLTELSNLCESNEKVATLLNVIAVNIAIESHRSVTSREMFMVFVAEVKEISEKILEVTRNLSIDSILIRNRQTEYQQEISSHLEHFQKLTRTAESVVNESVETIETILRQSQAILEKASGYSVEINTLVSSIVMSMQFHDIVRQQLEHVVTAINDARMRYKEPVERDSEQASEKTRMGKVCSTLMVQNAQLKSAIGEIDSAYQKIINAFQGIEGKIADLLDCMSYSSSDSSAKKEGENLFSIVLSGFEDLNRLLGDAFRLKSGINEVAEEATGATEGLKNHVDHVQQISLELQRKALNAIIKAAHLGDLGRALEVFAYEVTTASNDAGVFAANVIDHIQKISTLTEEMTASCRMKENGDLSFSPITKSIEDISRSYDSFMDNRETSFLLSKELEHLISETKSSLPFISRFSDDLKVLLERSEETLSQIKENYEFEAFETEISETSDNYTMESERLVHLSLLGDSVLADNECDPDKAVVADEQIELFDEPSDQGGDESGAESVAQEPDQKLPADIESVPEEEEGQMKNENSDEEFDDNIELF